MEYYVWRNGKAFIAVVYDERRDAESLLALLKGGDTNAVWFIEDEDGVKVEV